jgi:hypothetical protein
MKRRPLKKISDSSTTKPSRLHKYVLAGTLAAAGLGWTGLEYYSRDALAERQTQYAAQLAGTRHKASPAPVLQLTDRLSYLRRLSRTEGQFDTLTQRFVEYVRQNTDTVLQMTKDPAEHYGSIEYDGSFSFKESNTWLVNLRNDVKEVARNDFFHKKRLLDTIREYPELFEEAERKAIPLMLAAMEYNLQNQTPLPPGRFAVFTPDGKQIPIETELYESLVKNGQNYFNDLGAALDGTSPHLLDDEFLQNDRIYARFHTHPKDDPNYQPSPPDEANTHLMGPSVLLSESNGVLHVYTMISGKTKEVLTQRINR